MSSIDGSDEKAASEECAHIRIRVSLLWRVVQVTVWVLLYFVLIAFAILSINWGS
jgi:hypothetical protein